MPTLNQIQNFIKYRRQQQGDNNLLKDVTDYVNGKHYKSYKEDDDEMFFFGDKLGNGLDSNHFQLGFTSTTLLQRTLLNGMFHLNATYKIIKYFYPLIIFGITDYNHKFYPIVFMITSHESTDDYVHFLTELKRIIL